MMFNNNKDVHYRRSFTTKAALFFTGLISLYFTTENEIQNLEIKCLGTFEI